MLVASNTGSSLLSVLSHRQGRRSNSEQSWQRRKETTNSTLPSKTPNTSLRPLRGLASGTSHQVVPTNSRAIQTPFQGYQKPEIFPEVMRNGHRNFPQKPVVVTQKAPEDILFRKIEREPTAMKKMDKREGKGNSHRHRFLGRFLV